MRPDPLSPRRSALRPVPTARPRVERLPDRITPAVGAYDVPADITGRYAGVVQFGDGSGTEGCTGTLLADGRHILTAAHCITTAKSNPTVPLVGVTVRFDLPEEGGGLRRIAVPVAKESIFVHPDWTGDVNKGDDVAVIELPVLAPYGNGVRSLGYPINTMPDEPGRAFTFVGYGYTGTGTTGENKLDGRAGDIQRLTVADGAGPFKLVYEGAETDEISPTATDENIQAALKAIGLEVPIGRLPGTPGAPAVFQVDLSSLEAASAPFGVVETGPTGKVTVDALPASDGSAAEIVRLTLDPSAGNTVTLGFAGRSVTLSSSATPDQVGAALLGLLEAEGTGVRRIDVDQPPGPAGVYEIVFRNVDYSILTDRKIPPLTVAGAGSAAVLVANDIGTAKRAGDNTFLPSAELNGNLDAKLPPGAAAGQALLGAGDSGGPAFLNGTIAGIASYGSGNSGFGFGSSWARVSSFLPYIYEVTQIDRVQKTKYQAVLDLSDQPISAGVSHAVEVRQSGGVVRVTVDGVLFFSDLASNLAGVTVVGTADPTTVLRGFGLNVPLTVRNAREMIEPVPESARLVAVGAGAGGGPRVDLFAPDGTVVRSFFAFDPSFTGGVRVAVGDVTGDGVPDIVAAAGPGGGPAVKVFDGITGAEVTSFFAFDPAFTGGLSVAVGDLNGDGLDDIVVGAGPGGGPHVRVFALVGGTVVPTASFYAFEAGFAGGVNVAADGDRIVAGAGEGGGPVVASFTGDGTEVGRVFAFAPTFAGGVSVAAGAGLVAVAPGPGGGSAVQLLNPDLSAKQTVTTFSAAPDGGLTVALRSSDAGADLFVGPGRGAAGVVRRYNGPDFAAFDEVAFAPGFDGGVYVG